MTPRSITITPAVPARGRIEEYAERHLLKHDEVLTHLSGRLEVLNLVATELQTVFEATFENVPEGNPRMAGFELAVNVLTEHHRAVSEEFLSLWHPMPKQDDPGHSVRVATSANDTINDPDETRRYTVWSSWGGEPETYYALSALDALSRYSVAKGYSRYDHDAELLASVVVDDSPLRRWDAMAPFENTTLFAVEGVR